MLTKNKAPISNVFKGPTSKWKEGKRKRRERVRGDWERRKGREAPLIRVKSRAHKVASLSSLNTNSST